MTLGHWFLLFVSVFATVDPYPELNPALKLEEVAGQPGLFKGKDMEVQLQVLKLKKEVALSAQQINFQNILNLYGPRRNPYPGEVTELVKCDEKFKPKEVKIRVKGQVVNAVVGGVGSRRNFGACTEEEIEKVGLYFSYYNDFHLLEARLFLPYQRNKSWNAQINKVIASGNRLLP